MVASQSSSSFMSRAPPARGTDELLARSARRSSPAASARSASSARPTARGCVDTALARPRALRVDDRRFLARLSTGSSREGASLELAGAFAAVGIQAVRHRRPLQGLQPAASRPSGANAGLRRATASSSAALEEIAVAGDPLEHGLHRRTPPGSRSSSTSSEQGRRDGSARFGRTEYTEAIVFPFRHSDSSPIRTPRRSAFDHSVVCEPRMSPRDCAHNRSRRTRALARTCAGVAIGTRI